MKKFLSILMLTLILVALVGCKTKTTKKINMDPVISGVEAGFHTVGEAFDPLAGVTAKDYDGTDLTEDIEVTGVVDHTTKGKYTLTYSVTDSKNRTTTKTRIVSIDQYANGTYNFRFASDDLRNSFFAAAEKYLLNNMVGGVPLFANAGFSMFSSRIQLPSQTSLPVVGFGTVYGTMSADDSTVKMDNGQPGNAGEYTYRAAITSSPKTFLHWKYQDAVESDILTLLLDAPYVYKFNDDKTGFELVPSMASDNPQPQNGEVLNTGVTVAKKWRIPLREDLVWSYHPDTVTTGFPAGHEKINADDFVNTYKLALEQGWFRAISGGGDFLTSSQEVKGAKDFKDKKADWDTVGIKKVDEYTIEFEFVNNMSEWNVRYWLGSFTMGPLNLDLYNSLQSGENNTYGTDPKTTAYTGAFKLDYYEHDKIIRMKKNNNFHDKDSYFYTGWTYIIQNDATIRFQEFVDGKLDVTAVPTDQYDNYKSDPRLKRVPGATTFRLMINGLGNVENQKGQFEDSNYTPEPILANLNFKKAMYFAIDRKTLAEGVMKTSQTQQYLFTNAYIVNAASGTPFRDTTYGVSVGAGLSPETNGFNKDLAAAYWRTAINELVADGTYKKGDTIKIDLIHQSGSVGQANMAAFLKTSFEEVFQSSTHNIKVVVTPVPTAFPDLYYDFMMVGQFDLGVGGISGSTLDAASFLDVFSSDNRGGFTLNWGIDTSIPDIELTFTNPDTDETVTEFWSFNAIFEVLSGEVTLRHGREVVTE